MLVFNHMHINPLQMFWKCDEYLWLTVKKNAASDVLFMTSFLLQLLKVIIVSFFDNNKTWYDKHFKNINDI